ncbi:hypothetical protein C9F11_44925 (plasmid) [Streptomyces sp. YIM 121038]|uniref:DUF6192 family protein n=1 Tax=Streptomyces sp. YIM 121038 TaxID=2136401 RepID=UPI001110788B|nr:DUF6192 family protein [Streptomyces sp. YIM 121038]QCX82292.1 hypothetical protein C9F11_43570 [Streptomyces sp. YIM 121038]QCX82547.1 hypothetical protein C9F11_44925 [Streptomyces sp. YIM 121038]
MAVIGNVAASRYHELVASSLRQVEVESAAQWALGDAALEIEPIREWGGHLRIGEGGQRVEDSLKYFAEDVGLSAATVRTYRWVAAKWPAEHRVAGVSWEVHKILASADEPFEVIAHPPLNERTGRYSWDGDAAKRAVGWKTSTPVTVEEKVEAVTELVQDEAVACRVAVDLLKRREVVFVAMRDGDARYMVNEAQFEQAEADDEFDEEFQDVLAADELGGGEGQERFDDPATVVRHWHRQMEFVDLIAVCQGFIAGATRLVPKLRGQEFTERQHGQVGSVLEKLRATADWIETAVATGQTDLDEALAALLRGE